MAQKLFTESIESATLTLTNGGADSDEKLLKHRDLGVKGINISPATSSTVGLEIDYGTATNVDYLILGNLTTSLGVGIEVFYWTGAWTSDGTVGATTYANQNLYYAFAAARSATKYKIEFDPTSVSTLELACVFLGTEYDFPHNYQVGDTRRRFMRGEIATDFRGYPYSHAINSTDKHEWNVEYSLDDTQIQALEDELEKAFYGMKPFFIQDTIVDNDYHLIRFMGDALEGRQVAADYFKVRFNAREL